MLDGQLTHVHYRHRKGHSYPFPHLLSSPRIITINSFYDIPPDVLYAYINILMIEDVYKQDHLCRLL